MIKIGMRVQHVRRGSTYKVEGRSKMQISQETLSRLCFKKGYPIPHQHSHQCVQALEKVTLISYRCEQDDTLWVRPESEFSDGRFVEI